LIGAELFGPAAELVARQPLDQQPKLVVLGQQVRDMCRRRGDDLAQHAVQAGSVIWQVVEIDIHATIMINTFAS